MARLSSLNSTKPRSKKSTYTFSSIPSSIDEGSNGTFDITTTNVPDGTTLHWTIETNSGDFGTSSGSFTITNRSGSFTVTPTSDNATEGSETFTVAIRKISITGKIVATSSAVTINDTSATEPGSVLYASPGSSTGTAAETTSYTWTVPAGVTSISFVVTGGGAGGGLSSFTGSQWSGGGAGGATAYRNNVAVTPGQEISLTVGKGGYSPSVSAWNSTVTTYKKGGHGGASSINLKPGHAGYTTIAGGGVAASGGLNGQIASYSGAITGLYDGGGYGGAGGNIYGGGGGGGGGFSGNGGQGGKNPAAGVPHGGTGGAGGGGGGGGFAASNPTAGGVASGGDGGGAAGQTSGVYANYSAGTTGENAWRHISIGAPQKYGAGGGATYGGGVASTLGARGRGGINGAIRIIWPGTTRQFPSTDVWVQNSSGTYV